MMRRNLIFRVTSYTKYLPFHNTESESLIYIWIWFTLHSVLQDLAMLQIYLIKITMLIKFLIFQPTSMENKSDRTSCGNNTFNIKEAALKLQENELETIMIMQESYFSP